MLVLSVIFINILSLITLLSYLCVCPLGCIHTCKAYFSNDKLNHSSLLFMLFFCSNTVNSCKCKCQHICFRKTRKAIKCITPLHISSYFVDYCLAGIFFRYSSFIPISFLCFIHLSQLNVYITDFLKWGQSPCTSIALKHVVNFKHVCRGLLNRDSLLNQDFPTLGF